MTTLYRHSTDQALQAQQAYLVLIIQAAQGQRMTYEMLAQRMRYAPGAAHYMPKLLRYLKYWCLENNLPVLPVLVCSKDTGWPGHGLGVTNVNEETERVLAYDWCGLVPPTPDHLRQAWRTGRAAQGRVA